MKYEIPENIEARIDELKAVIDSQTYSLDDDNEYCMLLCIKSLTDAGFKIKIENNSIQFVSVFIDRKFLGIATSLNELSNIFEMAKTMNEIVYKKVLLNEYNK